MEVPVDEIQEVASADELHHRHPDHVCRENSGDASECEGADDSVSKRLALLGFRKAEDQDGQHERVIGAEQAFERDQEPDREKVGGLNHVGSMLPEYDSGNLDTVRIRS